MAGGIAQVWEMMTADNPDTRFLFWAALTIRANDKIFGLVSHAGRRFFRSRDGQDIEPSLLLVPVDTNPQVIPGEDELDGPRFTLHRGIVRFRLGQHREATYRRVGPCYLDRVLYSLEVHRVARCADRLSFLSIHNTLAWQVSSRQA